jgi:hypothetical protein
MTLSILWSGAFASSDGTTIAGSTNFISGGYQRRQTLFWGYASITIFLTDILAPGLPQRAHPLKRLQILLAISFVAYLSLAVACLWIILFTN